MVNKNLTLKKNFLFNTLNLNKKKILKKNFSQLNVQKKFGNFYSGIYLSIYNIALRAKVRTFLDSLTMFFRT